MSGINTHKNLWKNCKEINLRRNFTSSYPSIFQAGQESCGVFSGNGERRVLSEGFPSASQGQEHCSGYSSTEKINPNIYASQSTWRGATLIQESVFEGDGTDTRWICSLLALVCYSWQHKEGRGYVHKKSELLFIWTTRSSLVHSAEMAFFCCFSAHWQSVRAPDRPWPCTEALALQEALWRLCPSSHLKQAGNPAASQIFPLQQKREDSVFCPLCVSLMQETDGSRNKPLGITC